MTRNSVIVSALVAIVLPYATALAEAQSLYQHLLQVNREWRYHSEQLEELSRPCAGFDSEEELLQTHLRLVETLLRRYTPADLDSRQLAKRRRNLDRLHPYWSAGRFPINETHGSRIPVFVDRHETHCAVGWLLRESGKNELIRTVRQADNNIFIRDIHDPDFAQWQEQSGLTLAELALIQPSYPPEHWFYERIPLHRGAEITAAVFDTQSDVLYCAGAIDAIGGIKVNNVAALIDGQWQALGDGLLGVVETMIFTDGILYAGGRIVLNGETLPVVRWDGRNWHPMAAGSFTGSVKTLTLFEGELFAGGDFKSFTPANLRYLSVWRDGRWQYAGSHVNAPVLTMTIHDAALLAAGAFDRLNGDSTRIARFRNGDSNWETFASPLTSTIRCLSSFDKALYVGADNRDRQGLPAAPFARYLAPFGLGSPTWHSENKLFRYFGGDPPLSVTDIKKNNGPYPYIYGVVRRSEEDPRLTSPRDQLYDFSDHLGPRIPAISTSGRINDILLHKGKLFLAGEFDHCSLSVPFNTDYLALGGFRKSEEQDVPLDGLLMASRVDWRELDIDNLAFPTHPDDLDMLRRLYEQCGGPHWHNSDNWLREADADSLYEWYGVKMRYGRVVALNLAGNGLRGALPDDLFSLTELERIDLSNNELEALPVLRRVSNLYSLDIKGNRFSVEELAANLGLAHGPEINFSPQRFSSPPSDARICLPDRLHLRARDVKAAGVRYQFFQDGNPLSAASTNRELFMALHEAGQGGLFSCRITMTQPEGLEIIEDFGEIRAVGYRPAQPTLKMRRDTLICAARALRYQWTFNNTMLTLDPATDRIAVSDYGSGVFGVTVFNEEGCSAQSQPMSVSTTGFNSGTTAFQPPLLYPNPVEQILHLRIPAELSVEADIRVYSLLGQLVQSFSASDRSLAMDISHLEAGAYLVVIRLQDARIIKHFQKR